MQNGRTRFVAAALVALAMIGSVGAQEPRRLTHPDSIPYDLAAALIGGAFGLEPQIQVGGAPGWATQRLYIPPDGQVLGSSFLGTTVTIVIALPIAPDSIAAQQVRSELARRGWAEPPRPSYNYGGGFRPAVMASTGVQSPTRFTLCSSEYLLVGDIRRQAGMALHMIYRLSNGTTGVCHPPQFQGGAPSGQIRFPTLYEPDGTPDPRGVTACYPQNAGPSSGTGAIFRAPMSADRVLEHFARQLADSGWTRVRDSLTTARGEWTRTDSTGTPQSLTISVAAPRGVRDPQCYEAQMNVTQIKKP